MKTIGIFFAGVIGCLLSAASCGGDDFTSGATGSGGATAGTGGVGGGRSGSGGDGTGGVLPGGAAGQVIDDAGRSETSISDVNPGTGGVNSGGHGGTGGGGSTDAGIAGAGGQMDPCDEWLNHYLERLADAAHCSGSVGCVLIDGTCCQVAVSSDTPPPDLDFFATAAVQLVNQCRHLLGPCDPTTCGAMTASCSAGLCTTTSAS